MHLPQSTGNWIIHVAHETNALQAQEPGHGHVTTQTKNRTAYPKNQQKIPRIMKKLIVMQPSGPLVLHQYHLVSSSSSLPPWRCKSVPSSSTM